jgi:NADH dehydrogenase
VVVGAGFTGLEAAAALAGRGKVVLVDRSEVVGHQLGTGPRQAIEAALDRLGIERRLGTTVTGVGDDWAALSDGTKIPADAVVWSAGQRASALTAQISDGLDTLDRIPLDRRLRSVHAEIFVAGDAAAAPADAGHTVMQACQHATPLGKVAGYNAMADLLRIPLRNFTPGPYVTCLDLGAAGGIFMRGWERRVLAVGEHGAEIKRKIMASLHPPVDNAELILAAADKVHIDMPCFPC